MVLHCSIRSPREGRLYYNRGAKGHVPLARKQPLSTCLMCRGVSGSWEIQGRSEDGPEKWGSDGENPIRTLRGTSFPRSCPGSSPVSAVTPRGCGSGQGPWVPSIFSSLDLWASCASMDGVCV